MLHSHFANRFETLSALLIANTDTASSSHPVFQQDQVIVPSAAVKRRVTLDIARSRGICANVVFAYLAQWLWQQAGRLSTDVVQLQSPYDSQLLAWRMFAALNDAEWVRPYPRLAAYLERSDAVMRFELAQRVAGIFDQYITYRPEWIDAWAAGDTVNLGSSTGSVSADQEWQLALWRRLAAEMGSDGRHPAAAFMQALGGPVETIAAALALPAEAHIFCLPTMPPVHLTLLQLLGRRMDLHLYVLNPCREFWFEAVSRRWLATLATQGRSTYHEEGHRLLAAWGQQTQSHLTLLVDAAGEAATDDALFTPNPGAGLLAHLQNSVLEMADLAPASVELPAHDRSIEVHVCHSLTREIEVLQDRLLGLFTGPDAPAASDVLVVTPDLDAAALLVEAIFGTVPPNRFIPYTITGRARSDVNAPARALLDLLALASSRFTASGVFGLLQQPVVARRFGLSADDLDRVHAWLQDAGVHWALDAEHRATFGLPATGRHSFSDGLDRLFLGYALPSEVDTPFGGRLPAGGAEGSDALALGCLATFIDALAALRRTVSIAQGAPAWPAVLSDALATFVAPTDGELEDLREVHAALEQLGDQFQRSATTLELPLDVVRCALAQVLDDPVRGGVPTGMVTFTSMSSLRNIPYKVVCAIGLNDGAFPTAARPSEFDLLSLQPKRGDRQRRTDERNLFLDLLLAARDSLHLSYVGRSVRDNSAMPPSVLVSELLEYLTPVIADAGADAGALARARQRLVVEHPLQPFSEVAFRSNSDIRLRSYHTEYALALSNTLASAAHAGAGSTLPVNTQDDVVFEELDEVDDITQPSAPFFATPLPAPAAQWRDVPLERLLQFFRNPCRYLLERRLGIALRRDEEELQDDEPFTPDKLARSALARQLLPSLLSGVDPESARALALAGTDVPIGAFGREFLERELVGMQSFADTLAGRMREPFLPPHSACVELDIDGQHWRMHGGFAGLRAAGLLGYRYDDCGAGDFVAAWLRHVLLCASPPHGMQPVTTWLGRNAQFSFQPCAEPLEVLAMLLRLYAEGLQEPLYFFPKTAWEYLKKGGSEYAAGQAWRVTRQRQYAEGGDAGYRLALRGLPDPMGEGFDKFRACAHAVLDPLLLCLVAA